jgi:hypothetical protein
MQWSMSSVAFSPQANYTDVVNWPELLATYPGVPGSIPGATTFSDK